MRLVCLALAALAAFLCLRPNSRPDPAPRAARSSAPATDLAARWPAGRRFEYDVEATGRESTRLGATPDAVEARMDVAGRLVVRSAGPRGDRLRLSVGLRDLERATFTVMGHDLLSAVPPSLEVQIELDAQGRIVAAGVPAGAPDGLVPVVAWLMSGLQMAPSGGLPRWSGTEPAPLGDARHDYAPCDGEPRCVEKTLVGYARLDAAALSSVTLAPVVSGSARMTLDEDHVIEHVELREHVDVPDAKGGTLAAAERSMTFVRLSQTADAPPADLALSPLRQPTSAERLLTERADGMTAERVLEDLSAHALAAAMPDHSRWLWQVTGLLRLDPTVAPRLRAVFLAMPAGAPGRALVLDVLTHAGTPACQAVLRELLTDPEARRDPHHAAHFQRLALLGAPTAETVELARVAHRSGDRPPEVTSLTLGAVVGSACRTALAEPCREGMSDLRASLHGASDAERKLDVLRALGNAGQPEVEGLVDRFVDADDALLRLGAAAALRKIDTATARRSLVTLAGDEDDRVATRALMALGERPADEETMAGLARLAEGELADPGTAELLVNVLQPAAGTSAEARAALVALAQRPGNTPSLQRRVSDLLAAHP